MKWLIGCLLAVCLVSSAFAGEDPYVGIVGKDIVTPTLNADLNFYLSPKHIQFLLPPVVIPGSTDYIPYTTEFFKSKTPLTNAEVCDTLGSGEFPTYTTRGTLTSKTPAKNAGWYEWKIALPKKPSGEINLVFECGILKPNAFALEDFRAIEVCAAETGEYIDPGCSRQITVPGVSPVNAAALPMIIAVAMPGPYSNFQPFLLTAFRNPGTYEPAFDAVTGALSNNGATQLLNGGIATRILLKACMDKTVVVKMPVSDQINAGAAGQVLTATQITGGPITLTNVETDLIQGDYIYVRMNVPKPNTVDIYCGPHSMRLAGVGEAPG